MLEVKFKLNVNGIVKEIAGHGNVDPATVQTLDMMPGNLVKVNLRA